MNRAMRNALYIGIPILCLIAIISISRWIYTDSEYSQNLRRKNDSIRLSVLTLTLEENQKRNNIKHLDSDIHERTMNLNLLKDLDSFYGTTQHH